MLITLITGTALFPQKSRENLDDGTVAQPSKLSVFVFTVVFMIELFLMLWALVLAFRCGGKRSDRAVHMMLAFFVPIIYLIYYYIFSSCQKELMLA